MDIKITFTGGKKVEAEIEGMKIVTDQSIRYGGEGSAPEPYTYFLASIGTCAGIYVLFFCHKRGIPTDGISLLQRNEFITVEQGASRLGRVILEIIVPPDFPEKYHDAIVRVADQCAVKKTIMDPPDFEVKTRVQR